MTDIIARAQELATNGHTPGPWHLEADELDPDWIKVMGPVQLQGNLITQSTVMNETDADYPDLHVTAFAPDAVAALAQETYRYGVEIHMGGRWIMLASPSKGNSLDHAPWFDTKKQAESFRDNRTIKAHARIVRRRMSPTEVVE